MSYLSRKYVIIPTSELTDDMISSAIVSSKDTVRKALDNSNCMLKFDGDTPSCFSSYSIYTYDEIITELAKDTWTPSETEE